MLSTIAALDFYLTPHFIQARHSSHSLPSLPKRGGHESCFNDMLVDLHIRLDTHTSHTALSMPTPVHAAMGPQKLFGAGSLKKKQVPLTNNARF